jgi:hypothetical protein
MGRWQCVASGTGHDAAAPCNREHPIIRCQRPACWPGPLPECRLPSAVFVDTFCNPVTIYSWVCLVHAIRRNQTGYVSRPTSIFNRSYVQEDGERARSRRHCTGRPARFGSFIPLRLDFASLIVSLPCGSPAIWGSRGPRCYARHWAGPFSWAVVGAMIEILGGHPSLVRQVTVVEAPHRKYFPYHTSVPVSHGRGTCQMA